MDVVKTRYAELEERSLNTLNPQNQDTNEVSVRETNTRRASEVLHGLRVETKDVLQQLNANINYLEDLGGRLSFVLAEVGTLVRR